MAKQSDDTMLYVGIAVAAFLFLRSRSAAPTASAAIVNTADQVAPGNVPVSLPHTIDPQLVSLPSTGRVAKPIFLGPPVAITKDGWYASPDGLGSVYYQNGQAVAMTGAEIGPANPAGNYN